MALIKFEEGYYNIRGNPVNVGGMAFNLVGDFKMGKDGDGYVTVDGSSQPGFPERSIRIKCKQGAYEVVGKDQLVTTESIKTARVEESDEQIIERLRERFEVLEDMTAAVKSGDVRAMIVTGPPGVGKSFGVQKVLEKENLFDELAQRPPKYEFVKGAMSAIGLYSKLFNYSKRDEVLVFDDCDSVLLDDLSLNILKAALDSSKKRTIHWNTDSRILRSEGIPDSFEYRGGCIFITNLKFENVRSKKLQDHLSALESRCHFIDLQMDTDREKVLRIRQIVFKPEAGQVGILDAYEFDDVVKDEVVDYIVDNRSRMRELSLRTVLKVADLRKSFPQNWQSMSEVTVMKNAA